MAKVMADPSKTNDFAMEMAKKAEEKIKKDEEAKEAAFRKSEAEKAKKAEKEKADADAKEAEARKASVDNKGDADKEAAKKVAKEKRTKDKSFRKSHPTKLRVKLPPIDSYEKELEYIPDVPGRVIVRLERLMGTDRVRITDTKYLKTLLNQLEAEEQVTWAKRAKQRKLAERNRFRQLAIEGHMEPGPDMQDLFQHPVFRVNRILNRLSKLDTKINHAPIKKLPPITPVEPFEEYARTGKLFDFHPGHYLRTITLYKDDEKEVPSPSTTMLEQQRSQQDADFFKKLEAAKRAGEEATAAPRPDRRAVRRGRDLVRADEWGGEGAEEWEGYDDYEDYEDEEDYEEEEYEEEEQPPPEPDFPEAVIDEKCAIELLGRGSLTDAKEQYGINPSEDLLADWMPFRSELIDQVYDDEAGGAEEMYEFAKAVLGTYKRETLKADNFVTKGLRKF